MPPEQRAAPQILDRGDGQTLAYHALPGKSPGVVFCGGFRSDMTGTKATALEAACRRAGRAFVRFDYFAHGQSSGEFLQATIGRWAADTIAILDRVAQGPQVLVGSSMGGWLALLAALARPQQAPGLVFIAPAVDFTEALMRPSFPPAARQAIERDGVWLAPSDYSAEPYPITRLLLDEGRDHLLLGAPIPFEGPVRILHGMRDPDVPWQHSLQLIEALAAADVTLTLVKDGDHRLSTPDDLRRLTEAVEEVAGLL